MLLKLYNDDELFLQKGWPTKGIKAYFYSEQLSEILINVNLWQATSRFWICAEPEFRLHWKKLCSSDNHHTTTPQKILFSPKIPIEITRIKTVWWNIWNSCSKTKNQPQEMDWKKISLYTLWNFYYSFRILSSYRFTSPEAKSNRSFN